MNGQSKICGRQPLKKLKHFKFFKGSLQQILLGPFLNTVTQIMFLLITYFDPNNIAILQPYFRRLVTFNQ